MATLCEYTNTSISEGPGLAEGVSRPLVFFEGLFSLRLLLLEGRCEQQREDSEEEVG